MKKIVYAILVILLATALSCSGKEIVEETVEFERVIPAAEGVPEGDTAEGLYTPDPAEYEAALQGNMEDMDLRFGYMIALRRSGRIDEALEQVRIVVNAEGDNQLRVPASLNFAEMVLDEMDTDDPDRDALLHEGIDMMYVALGYEMESVASHKMMGRLLLETGQEEAALHFLSIALTVTEIGYELRMRMAEIYEGMGEYDRAWLHLQAAMSIAEEAGLTEGPQADRMEGLYDLIEPHISE